MGRRILCYGPLLALFIIFGVSFGVCSDVNALRHDVKYIPISSDMAFTSGSSGGFNSNVPFSITWSNSFAPSYSDFKLNQNHYFTSRVDNNRCTFVNFSDTYHSLPVVTQYQFTTEFSYGFDSYRYFYDSNLYPDLFNKALCMQNKPFGTLYSNQSNLLSHPNFDESSLVNIPAADRPPYLGLMPYYYDFDSFFVDDVAIDTNTGEHYPSSLRMSDIVGFSPVTNFHSLTIPLGRLNENTVGVISQGRPVKFKGVFDFSGEGNTFAWNSDLSTSYFRLYYAGLNESASNGGSSNTGGYAECSTNFISVPFNDLYQLEFECSFTSPTTYYNGQLWFYLKLDSGSSSYLFDTNSDWSFTSSYFVTDNDETPGDVWGNPPTGNHLSSAPGSAQGLLPSDDDFFSSLVNQFSFNFFNPFAPMFSLFTDSSSCASIPVIAGMLHSESTSVCPWFDSTTRNILTPVLGLSSSVILFGFLVRWLSGSSGNFFDDASSENLTYGDGYDFERNRTFRGWFRTTSGSPRRVNK